MSQTEEPVNKTGLGVNYPFRWRYIIIPLVIFALTAVLAAVCYARLPEETAYFFQDDDSPGRLAGRGVVVTWILVIQLVLLLAAGAITWGMTALSDRHVPPEGAGLRPERIITLMGNMIALPQVIAFFALLDIFSYNSYQIHLLPLWIFAVIVLVVGGIVLGVFFIQAILQVWRTSKE